MPVVFSVPRRQPVLTVSQRQVKEGIDAVIVDNVLAIRKGLTTTEAEVLNGEVETSEEGSETGDSV